MNLKAIRRAPVLRNRRPFVWSSTVGITTLAGLFAVGVGGPAAASYVPPLSDVITIQLVDPGNCVSHTFFVTVASDAGHPRGTARLLANGTLVQARPVPASGSLTMTVSSSRLRVGANTMTASFVPSGNWSPATSSIVINNLAPAACTTPTGAGPLIDTGMAPDPTPAGLPVWFDEALLCAAAVSAGGFLALRVSKP